MAIVMEPQSRLSFICRGALACTATEKECCLCKSWRMKGQQAKSRCQNGRNKVSLDGFPSWRLMWISSVVFQGTARTSRRQHKSSCRCLRKDKRPALFWLLRRTRRRTSVVRCGTRGDHSPGLSCTQAHKGFWVTRRRGIPK